MGGNTVSGAGGSKDPKKVADEIRANQQDFRLMQLQQQRERLNKEIQEKLRKNDSLNSSKEAKMPTNQQKATLDELEKQIETEKAYLEKQLNEAEGQLKSKPVTKEPVKNTDSDEYEASQQNNKELHEQLTNLNTPESRGFVGITIKKLQLAKQKKELEAEILENYKNMTPEQKAEFQMNSEIIVTKNAIEKQLLDIETQENNAKIQKEIKEDVKPKYSD